MFPLKDNIPARVFPVVNIGLIIVNIAAYVYAVSHGESTGSFLSEYGFVPARFLGHWDLLDFSAQLVPVYSSMFLHGSVLHLVGNMWMLWIFGDNVEDAMGHGRYLFFYLLCGMASVASQAFVLPLSTVPMIGASGAISGVLGAYFCLYPRARILTFVPIFIFLYLVEVPSYFFLGLWFFIQFLQGWANYSSSGGVASGVAWWAHVGGFVAGVLMVRLFIQSPVSKKGKRS